MQSSRAFWFGLARVLRAASAHLLIFLSSELRSLPARRSKLRESESCAYLPKASRSRPRANSSGRAGATVVDTHERAGKKVIIGKLACQQASLTLCARLANQIFGTHARNDDDGGGVSQRRAISQEQRQTVGAESRKIVTTQERTRERCAFVHFVCWFWLARLLTCSNAALH